MLELVGSGGSQASIPPPEDLEPVPEPVPPDAGGGDEPPHEITKPFDLDDLAADVGEAQPKDGSR